MHQKYRLKKDAYTASIKNLVWYSNSVSISCHKGVCRKISHHAKQIVNRKN